MRSPRFLIALALCLAFAWSIHPARAAGPEEIDQSDATPEEKLQALLSSAKIAPIQIPDTSFSTGELRKQIFAWLDRVYGQPERERISKEKWSAESLDFLDKAMRWWSGLERPADFGELARQGEALIDGRGGVPLSAFLVGELYSAAGDRALASRWWLTARSQVKSNGLPAAMMAMIDARRMATADKAEEKAPSVEADLLASTKASLSDGSYSEGDWPVFLMHHTDVFFGPILRPRATRFMEFYMEAPLPEWVRLTLAGKCEFELAWKARGTSLARDVTPDQWKGYHAHQAAAHKLLEKAWNLNPNSPQAPRMMITIANGEDKDFDEVRLWFDRSVAAQSDYALAYESMLLAMEPSWGGNIGQTMAFGIACAQTRRWDLEIPLYLDRALYKASLQMKNWSAIYRHPAVAPLVMEVRNAYLQRAELPAKRQEEAAMLLIDSWATGDSAAGLQALEYLRKGSQWLPFGQRAQRHAKDLSIDLDVVRASILAHSPETAALLGTAHEELRKGHFEEAANRFSECAAKLPDDRKAFAVAGSALAQFQKAYASGEWTRLPLDTDLAWLRQDGEWTWRPDQRRMSARGDDNYARLVFRGDLGTAFEVRGRFSLPSASGPKTGFGLIVGHSDPYTPKGNVKWWSARLVGRGEERATGGWSERFDPLEDSEGGVGKFNLQKENRFVFRRAGRTIDFTVNDDVVLEHYAPSDKLRAGEGAFGFGFWTQTGAPACEFWDCEVRMVRPENGKTL